MKSILVIHALVPLLFVPAALAGAASITGDLPYFLGVPLTFVLILLPMRLGIGATRSRGVLAAVVSWALMVSWLASWLVHPGVAFSTHPLHRAQLAGPAVTVMTPALLGELFPIVWARMTWPTVVAFLIARLWGPPLPAGDEEEDRLRTGNLRIALWVLAVLFAFVLLVVLAGRWSLERDLARDRGLEHSSTLLLLDRPIDVERAALVMCMTPPSRRWEAFKVNFERRFGHDDPDHVRLTEALLALARRRDALGDRALVILAGGRADYFSCTPCLIERAQEIDRSTRAEMEAIVDAPAPTRRRVLVDLRFSLGERLIQGFSRASTIEWIRDLGVRGDAARRERLAALVATEDLLPLIDPRTPEAWSTWFHRYGPVLAAPGSTGVPLRPDPRRIQESLDVIDRPPGGPRGGRFRVLVCPGDESLAACGAPVLVHVAIEVPSRRLGSSRWPRFMNAQPSRLQLTDGRPGVTESDAVAPVEATDLQRVRSGGSPNPIRILGSFQIERGAFERYPSRCLVLELLARAANERECITSESFRLREERPVALGAMDW